MQYGEKMDLSNIDPSKLSFSEKFYLKCIQMGDKVHQSLDVMTKNPMKYNTDLLMKFLRTIRIPSMVKNMTLLTSKQLRIIRKKFQ